MILLGIGNLALFVVIVILAVASDDPWVWLSVGAAVPFVAVVTPLLIVVGAYVRGGRVMARWVGLSLATAAVAASTAWLTWFVTTGYRDNSGTLADWAGGLAVVAVVLLGFGFVLWALATSGAYFAEMQARRRVGS